LFMVSLPMINRLKAMLSRPLNLKETAQWDKKCIFANTKELFESIR